ncbi:MAG: hypothetical protein GTN40_03600 [Candidatus Aenigmarchaeota archaeon]|nr:hypothetical protein [Candidatus Aenigmarchaeota archaeon]
MKTLVTHIKPHIDEIVAVWLFCNFYPGFKRARIKFIPASQTKTLNGKDPDSNPKIFYLGVCRGKFDEHASVVNHDCTSSLVWEHFQENNFVPKSEVEKEAIDRLIKWVTKEDTARFKDDYWWEFSISSLIRGSNKISSDIKTVKFGFKLIEYLFIVLKEKVQFEKDWENRTEFNSKWGEGACLETTVFNDAFIYTKGYQLVILCNPHKGFKQIRGNPRSLVDLTNVYEKLKEIDPGADWYFHAPSRKLLICGDDIASNVKKSKLGPKELIELVKR